MSGRTPSERGRNDWQAGDRCYPVDKPWPVEGEGYVWIYRWGSIVGSHLYYMEAEAAKAERDGAPLDAIYCCTRGTGGGAGGLTRDEWVTLDQVRNTVTLAWMTRLGWLTDVFVLAMDEGGIVRAWAKGDAWRVHGITSDCIAASEAYCRKLATPEVVKFTYKVVFFGADHRPIGEFGGYNELPDQHHLYLAGTEAGNGDE